MKAEHIVAKAETIMAIHAKWRVCFRSMNSSFLLLHSTTASSAALLSYKENKGHFFPLSFLKTALSISAASLIPILSAFHISWKHFTELSLVLPEGYIF